MRVRQIGTALLAIGVLAGGALSGGALTAAAEPADDSTPSRAEVAQAREDAAVAAADVETVRARLVLANQRLQDASIAAAQAAEAFNGARWQAREARRRAAEAERSARLAQADVERQRDGYADALVSSYRLAPSLTGLSAMTRADGIDTVLDRMASVQNAEQALDDRYDEFRALATLAEVGADQAVEARREAELAADRARQAHDRARSAADAAAAEAAAVAEEKTALIARLAELQGISVELAERRQAALERRAQAAAAAAAQEAADEEAAEEAEQEAPESSEESSEESAGQSSQDQPQPQSQNQPQNQAPSQPQSQPESGTDPAPAPAPEPEPEPEPAPAPAPAPTPPAPAAGADAAIAFARAQIGEPYRWAAAGPDAWDCSGLTMGAWAAGGKSLPHYSVAQYEQATPVSAGQLRPGDLVFWGSSSSPSSIYHVALYVGDGRIVHAPRTGRPVVEESLYYWIPPNFHARPTAG